MISLSSYLPVFNWENFLTHISEFVRVDEHLRMKQMSLETVTPENTGWTFLAGKEVTEHKRILNNMRCFLHYHAREIWGSDAIMFSKTEYDTIKTLEDNPYKLYEDMPGYDSVSNDDQFWFLMRAIHDKKAPNIFYKVLIELIYKTIDGRFLSGLQKDEITQNILSTAVFTLP